MTELNAAESSVVATIESSPGISATDLARQLGRRTQEVLRTVDELVSKGRVQRRQAMRTRIDGRQHSYNGLHTVAAALDPNVCPRCLARRRHYEGGPDCVAIIELRALGELLDWERIPLDYAKAIQTGKSMWGRFLDTAPNMWLTAGIRNAKLHVQLQEQTRRQQQATASAAP